MELGCAKSALELARTASAFRQAPDNVASNIGIVAASAHGTFSPCARSNPEHMRGCVCVRGRGAIGREEIGRVDFSALVRRKGNERRGSRDGVEALGPKEWREGQHG